MLFGFNLLLSGPQHVGEMPYHFNALSILKLVDPKMLSWGKGLQNVVRVVGRSRGQEEYEYVIFEFGGD